MSHGPRPSFQSDADTTLLASALLLIRSDAVANDGSFEMDDCTASSKVESVNLEPRPIVSAPPGLHFQPSPKVQNLAAGSTNHPFPQAKSSLFSGRARQNCLILPAQNTSPSSVSKVPPCDQVQLKALPAASSSASMASNRQRVLSDVDSIAGENVRREQVEAALRSKPQRGRKRNELTDVERLELTRTRNREHAKSTRIRKKARYQELEAKEAELEQLQSKQQLEDERRQSIMDFFVVREEQISEERNSAAAGGDSALVQQEAMIRLRGLVDDPSAFQFEDDLSGSMDTGFEGLRSFDETLTRRAQDRFGRDALRLLTYSTSKDKVAVSQGDVAFAEVDVQLSGQHTVKLLSAVAKVRFASCSHKIVSVHWHTTQDDIDDVSLEPIGSQTSYPSVVSLDPTTDPSAEKRTVPEADAESGPGMSI